MSPEEATNLIENAGGNAAFGRLLGIDHGDGWMQRVHNWKARGIPSDVVLKHYDTIQQLRTANGHRSRRARAAS